MTPAVAVTGGTGFVGRAVLRDFVGRGWRVRALHRGDAVPDERGVDWVTGDIGDPAAWDRLLDGADVVAHLAFAAMPDLGAVDENVQTNLPAFADLMHACRRHGLRRVVLTGSCFEYGATGDLITDRGLREDDALRPTSIYAATKAAITLLAGPLAEKLELDAIVLRPFHVYGPNEPSFRLIPMLLDAARTGQEVATTDGKQVRDFIHRDDVAGAFAAAVTAPAAGPGARVFNVGTGVATPVADAVRMIAGMAGLPLDRVKLGSLPHREHEMFRLVADPERARRELGWSPQIRLEEGLRALAAGGVKS